jgi:hypothetical protein
MMLPADQYIPRACVTLNGLSDSAGVVAVDCVVEVDTVRFEGFGEWTHGEVWTGLAAVFCLHTHLSVNSLRGVKEGGQVGKRLRRKILNTALTVLRMLCDDVPDVILALAAEDLDKRLGAIDAQSRETVLVVAVGKFGRFLAVADEVDRRGRRLGRLMSCQGC